MLKYMTSAQVINLHARIMAETGGPPGIRSIGGIESAVVRPFALYGDEVPYPTLEEKAAALTEAISRSHPFVDGNKRVAISAGCILLMLNGRAITATEGDLEHTAWSLAAGELDFDALVAWFRQNSAPAKAAG